ncbi:hypothetical protein VB735_15385 [Halotia wernerae UHCC 0503]|nr:hypothetical protein [Halotia wernerae UHCC 0503]
MLNFATFAKIYLGSYFGKGIDLLTDILIIAILSVIGVNIAKLSPGACDVKVVY